MIKPFPSNDSSDRGSSFSRRPILLAKLPHVGAKADRAPIETPPTAHVYVDHGHPVSESATAYPQTLEIDEPEILPDEPPAPRTYHRHDYTHPASQHHHSGRGSRRRSKSGIVQAQKMIFSHSGLIVTLALTACALLLLLTIVNPPEAPIDQQGEAYGMYGSAPAEVPHFDHGTTTTSTSGSEPADEPLDLFAADTSAESAKPAGMDEEAIDLFSWDDSFESTQESSSERISAKPVATSRSTPATLETLPAMQTVEDEEPFVESELQLSDPTATNYPRTKRPELDLSLLIEISEQHLGIGNPEMTELPMVPSSGTMNR